MNPVRYFIVVVCAASFGALASVVTALPGSFLLVYSPPTPSIDRESRNVAGADPAAAASAAGGG